MYLNNITLTELKAYLDDKLAQLPNFPQKFSHWEFSKGDQYNARPVRYTWIYRPNYGYTHYGLRWPVTNNIGRSYLVCPIWCQTNYNDQTYYIEPTVSYINPLLSYSSNRAEVIAAATDTGWDNYNHQLLNNIKPIPLRSAAGERVKVGNVLLFILFDGYDYNSENYMNSNVSVYLQFVYTPYVRVMSPYQQSGLVEAIMPSNGKVANWSPDAWGFYGLNPYDSETEFVFVPDAVDGKKLDLVSGFTWLVSERAYSKNDMLESLAEERVSLHNPCGDSVSCEKFGSLMKQGRIVFQNI